MEPIDLAIIYYDKLQKVEDKAQLSVLALEIRGRLGDLVGYEDWLRDAWQSRNYSLSLPNVPFESTLNKAGLKALKRGQI